MTNNERFIKLTWAACEIPFLVVFLIHSILMVASTVAAYTDSEYWLRHLICAAIFLLLSYASWCGLKISCRARHELDKEKP